MTACIMSESCSINGSQGLKIAFQNCPAAQVQSPGRIGYNAHSGSGLVKASAWPSVEPVVLCPALTIATQSTRAHARAAPIETA